MASTTTAPSEVELSTRSQRPSAETGERASVVEDDTTDILAASRLADSTVPEGGYGWVVIFACSVITFWFVGTSYSYGIIQAAFLADKVASASTLSFVGSVTVVFIAVLAIPNARLIRWLGAQRTALLGVFLLGLGELSASFTTKNVGGLFATAGVIMGVGTSMLFMVVSVTPTQYFNKKRGFANGIVYAAGGLGGTVISFALNGLISRVGTAWTYRVIGFITLATGLPSAYLIKERAPLTAAVLIDKSLLRDRRFIVLFFAGALATFPLFVPPFFLPLYSTSLGLSSSAGAGLVAGFNFSSAIGRLLLGLNADLVGPLNTLLISLIVSGLSMLVIWPISNSLGPLIAFAIINGIANGGFFAVMPTVVGAVFGSRRVSVAMGMMVTGWTGGYLLGAPIAGFMLAAYGPKHGGPISLDAYHPAIFYAGSMALAASALVAFVRFNNTLSLKKRI